MGDSDVLRDTKLSRVNKGKPSFSVRSGLLTAHSVATSQVVVKVRVVMADQDWYLRVKTLHRIIHIG